MKTILLFICITLIPFISQSQSLPACDSVQIDCCTYNTIGPKTITIQASNQSTYLFPYPGFILFNMNMDTVAIETVDYFGIGTFPQAHNLDIILPFDLPFEGILELHSLFFETHDCTFPLMIEDSVQTKILDQSVDILSIYPNPAKGNIYLEFDKTIINNGCLLLVRNPLGKIVLEKTIEKNKIQIQDTDFGPSGVYLIQIFDQNGNFMVNKKVIIQD